MEIRSDVLELTASFPVMMRYKDVCSALGINDKYLYKMLSKNKIIHINLMREKRIPRAFFAEYIIEGVNCNRSKKFISAIYKEMLMEYPYRLTIKQVCEFLQVSKSTVKRMIANGDVNSYHYHHTYLIYIYKDSLLKYLIKHTVA